MLDISSAELMGANAQLRAEAERQREILASLQASVERLADGAPLPPRPASDDFESDLLRLTHLLEHLVQQREQARGALAKAEANHRRILNSLREVVFQTDLAGHWVYLNPAWEAITGFSVVDSLGRRALGFVLGEDQQQHLQALIALLSQRSADFRQTLRFRTHDGGQRWLQVYARRIEDERGNVTGMSGSLIDVTEQKLTQDQLAVSEERLRQALKGAESRLWDWNMDEAQPYVEEAWLLGLGYGLDDPRLRGIDWRAEMHPDDAWAWHVHLKEHLRQQRPELDIELRFRTASGAWRYTALRGKVIAWRGKRALRIAGTLQDISARKLAELEAQRQRELTEQILDQLPLPVFLKDRDGRFVRLNRQFCQMAPLPKAQMLGRRIEEFATPGWVAMTAREDEEAWRTGRLITAERRLKFVDPPIDLLVNRVVITSGGESYLLGFAIDISEQRAAREAMQRAIESAEAASRAKSEFLANMSHEIRTPMNGILGMTELVLESKLSGQQREDIGLVKASADALLTIVNDILDFSKIEAGKLDIEDIPFDPARLAHACVRAMQLRAQQKGLRLALELGSGLPPAVKGDPGRLRQVLLNLLGNAIKFTEQGEVVLTVAVGRVQAHRVDLHFAVRDTGIGIPADKQRLIFEAFAQADGSTTRQYGGTGLGLTISRRLVILMQGELLVDSEPGRGSTFYFTLPLTPSAALADDEDAAQPPSLAPLLPGASAAGGCAREPVYSSQEHAAWRLRVLLAEDNPVNQRLAVRLLERLGHHITLVDNGLAALEHAQAGGFDLILLDVQMPGLDGLSVARHIRQREADQGEGAHVPIVAMTARAMQGDRERCLAAGMDDYLSKPIDAARLRDVVRRFDAGAQQPVLAWQSALKRLDDDLDLFLELAGIFLVDGPALFETLAAAVRRGEREAIQRAAHSLKGVLVNFGAGPAQDALEQLARSLAAGDSAAMLGQLATLGPLLDEVYAALRALIAEHGAA
nr:PAS domain S-box protein [Massilia sp. TS11]